MVAIKKESLRICDEKLWWQQKNYYSYLKYQIYIFRLLLKLGILESVYWQS